MAHRAGTQIRFLFQIYSPMYQHTPQGVNTCCIINVTLRVLCTTNGTYVTILELYSFRKSESLDQLFILPIVFSARRAGAGSRYSNRGLDRKLDFQIVFSIQIQVSRRGLDQDFIFENVFSKSIQRCKSKCKSLSSSPRPERNENRSHLQMQLIIIRIQVVE